MTKRDELKEEIRAKLTGKNYDDWFTEVADFIIQREAEKDKEATYTPNHWKCLKCGFFLVKNILYVQRGSVGPDKSEHGEPCPNDSVPLMRVTWQERVMDLAKICESKQKEILALKAACASKDKALREVSRIADRTPTDFVNSDLVGDICEQALLPKVGKEMVEALEFYGDEEVYSTNTIMDDLGDIARRALGKE